MWRWKNVPSCICTVLKSMTCLLYWFRGLRCCRVQCLLLPPSTLHHSLHCLDAIQMFFFSTPLWREPTPIVHKISPMVPADPVQRTTHNVVLNRQSCILSLGFMIRCRKKASKVNIATIATLFWKILTREESMLKMEKMKRLLAHSLCCSFCLSTTSLWVSSVSPTSSCPLPLFFLKGQTLQACNKP